MNAKSGHGHLHDIGFGSLVAYFFCVVASASIRSSSESIGASDNGVLVSILAFAGAVSLALLFLAMADSYLLRHDKHGQLAAASGVLMTFGPLCVAIESAIGAFNPLVSLLAFALSGCGYAACLVVWGRILSAKDVDSSARQVLADSSAAVAVMVIASLLPGIASALVVAGLGLAAGIIGSGKVAAFDATDQPPGQVVVSDTRESIPWTSYLAGGVPWMTYGVFLALLSDVHVLEDYLDVATLVMLALVAVAGIAIVRLHRRPHIDLSRMSWASVPLLVTGLVVYVAGEAQLLRLAVLLILLSMIVSYLHLMTHFAALAHRPDLLSDQMFAWGWLAPSVGLFVGVFAGIVFRLADDPSLKLFLSLLGGVLVVILIFSMGSIEKIALRHREREIGQQAKVDAEAARETRLDEVLAEMGLSMREREVALLLLQGRSQAVIAEQLFVAASTVNTHVKHIYQKVNVCSKQDFINLCYERMQSESDESSVNPPC